MVIEVAEPDVDGLGEIVDAMRAWQVEGDPVQLHPGDLGWFWRFGEAATAAAVRAWRRDGRLVAVGMLDEPTVLRVALVPGDRADVDVVSRIAADLDDPEAAVLPAGPVSVELPPGSLARDALAQRGWVVADPWTPMVRDLSMPVEDAGLGVEVVTPALVSVRTALQRAAFERSTFTDDRWRAMADGPAYADARCLVAHDGAGNAVAAATVWSAGEGRPGLIEPLGVHRDHRGRGHGRAMTLACAAALRDLGASSAQVVTPSSNEAAVATYASAGFAPLPARLDLRRPA